LNENIVKISRKELYEQVWTEPVTRPARRYGFSDVWLAKICRKNNMPGSPRGYWARKQSGQNIPKASLPKGIDDPVIEIHVRPLDSKEKDVIRKEAVSERRLIPGIVVPEVLKEPRKIARSLKRSAERSTRRKAAPYASAMSMLNFYINRAGKNLNSDQRQVLQQAKFALRKIFHRPQ